MFLRNKGNNVKRRKFSRPLVFDLFNVLTKKELIFKF